MNRKLRLKSMGACAALLLAAGCATNPATGHKEFSLVSPQQELALGKEGYQAVLAEYGAYDEFRLAAYIDSVGQRVAAASHQPELDWHFTLLDDPAVNAFAMPGGYIYITRGILSHLNSEAQLAGVLGHEIGHVTARHSAAQMTKQQLTGLGLGLASVVSTTARRYSELAQQALGLLFLKYSRDNENQADELGVQYATKAGWDPREIPSTYVMLRRVGEQAGQRIPSFMSTHPDPGDREVRTRELAKTAATGKSGLVIKSRDYVKRLDGIVYGDDPRHGFFEGATFVHPELAFQITFPTGWKTQNTRAAVMAGAPDQTAVMQLSVVDAKGQTPVQYVQGLSTSGKIDSFQGQRETIGGADSWIGRLAVTGKDGKPMPLAAAFLSDGARMYQILGQTQGDDAAIFTSMRSFKKVTDPARLAVALARVKVVTVPKSGAFSSVVAALGPQQIGVEEESVLNNVEPEETVAMGTVLKLVPKAMR